ncbi:MAG: FCSD flavin-binding domain-containing protein, partial [Campylobacterota bacterium]
TCFSVVATNPEQAIYIYSEYAYNKSDKSFSFADTSVSEDWKKEGKANGNSVYKWADALYTDMFS